MHGSGGQDHLTGFDRCPLTIEPGAHADRAPTLDHDAIDERVADDAEVGPIADRFEVRVVRGDAFLAHRVAIDRVRRHALPVWSIVIRAPSVAQRCGSTGQRMVDRAPSLLGDAKDRHGPVGAVPRVGAEVVVGLEAPVVRQHVVPSPPGNRPLIVILRQGANGEDAVDGGRAAHAATAPEQLGFLHAGAASEQSRVLQRVELALTDDEARIERAHLCARVGRPPVRARLEQQHRPMRVLAQPRREHAPCGTASDDDDVRGGRHQPSFARLPSTSPPS